jgi:hypothetical protein
MKNNSSINFYKWNINDYKSLFNSLKEYLNIESCQFYMPFFSLYYYIHNTKKSHKKIDLHRKYYIKDIQNIINQKYYNSNLILEGLIYDSSKKINEIKEVFCKTIPILEPIHCINNNYNLINKNNYHLPSNYNYNTFNKINDINNTAYIDVICSYLFSHLVVNKILPSFALFYGSVNGIGNYNYDITEEYEELKIDKCFNQNINKSFKIKVYVSSDEESDEEESDFDEYSDYPEELSEISYEKSNSNNDYISTLNKIPLQLLFIEKLEGTLEDYILSPDVNGDVILSCIFQISFALNYLQKHFKFTHNDLHISNVMYSNTDIKYLYYKINNKYFRIPTYGKIFKIIDFGRAIFTYNNKIFMNDVFSKNSEAWGQFYYPPQVNFLTNYNDHIPQIQPNYNFDLCRLSMTILEEINTEKINKNVYHFLNDMCIDCNGDNFCDMDDDFSLYIKISKNAVNSKPIDIINSKIFKQYRVTKKKFPNKSYYSI